tara:strand:+ start:2263 stop:2460 length:198 start_codon:yes stop_codon:yes gene_type:complete
MKIDTTTMSPWSEVHRLVSNMKTLTVMVGDKAYAGEADMISDDGHVVMSFDEPKAKPKAKVKGRK